MVFGRKKKQENDSTTMQPNFSEGDIDPMNIDQNNPIFNQDRQMQPQQPQPQPQYQQQMQPLPQVQPQPQVQQQQQQPQKEAMIVKVEYTQDGDFIYTVASNYLLQLGSCKLTQ